MSELKVLAIHGCCMGDSPGERVSGGIRRSTANALKSAGYTDVEVKAPFYGGLLFAYARGEIGLFEEATGLEGLESLGGGPELIVSSYESLAAELAMETLEELRLPIPAFVREWALHTFMTDVSTYLAMARAKEAIWKVVTDAWNEFGEEGPDLIVSHSLGTVVAWELLATHGAELSQPKGLLMMGSPLYLGDVRNSMAPLDRALGVGNWIHIYDDGDLVAGGRKISNHYPAARDVEVDNPAFPTSHDYPGYIRAAATGGLIGELVG